MFPLHAGVIIMARSLPMHATQINMLFSGHVQCKRSSLHLSSLLSPPWYNLIQEPPANKDIMSHAPVLVQALPRQNESFTGIGS